MQPNLPAPSQNPYDFILNSGQPQVPGKMPRISSGGSGQKQRIIFVAIAGFIVLILGIIVFNILSSAGKGNTTLLKNLAAEQTELIRVSDLALTKAKSTKARNLAASATITIRTTKQRTTKLLSLKGAEVTPKELGAKLNDKTDAALNAAEQANRYDEVYIEYMLGALAAYQNNLKTAYDANTETNDRDVLSSAFASTALIYENQTATN
ncbi:MAG: hypothetical protein KIH63_004920 [Candidatus Saccharibacteria bacterium]|nr:hypothetical protein [Candidatus Saccharibacteria bacterium]